MVQLEASPWCQHSAFRAHLSVHHLLLMVLNMQVGACAQVLEHSKFASWCHHPESPLATYPESPVAQNLRVRVFQQASDAK